MLMANWQGQSAVVNRLSSSAQTTRVKTVDWQVFTMASDPHPRPLLAYLHSANCTLSASTLFEPPPVKPSQTLVKCVARPARLSHSTQFTNSLP